MDPIEDLRGIITVLNTPFTEKNQIDIQSLEKNVTMALKAGVRGFLVPAMASEVGRLSDEEKILMVKSVVKACDGKAAVIGGTSALDIDAMCRLGEANLKAGCRGILANIPYTGEDQYRQAVNKLDSLNPDFLMLQDWDAGGYGLPVDMIVSLHRDYLSFKCLKIETVPAGIKYSEVLKRTKGQLHLSGGWAVSQMLEGLNRGIHAFMPTGMHSLYCSIYRLYTEGDEAGARILFEQLQPILAFSNQHLDISIHFFKRLLWKQGIYRTPAVRKPILPFDKIHMREADHQIKRVISLEGGLS